MNLALKKGEVLPLMESFYTLQGEGNFTGVAAYFIRLGGCDVGCHWCDVKESWDAGKHTILPIEKIVDGIDSKANKVVITGGEPLLWNLTPLTQMIREKGIAVHLETSGAYPLTGEWDWICLSPKKNKLPTDNIYKKADELKMIIYNKDDFLFAEKIASKVSENCKLYLQPEWSRVSKMAPQIVNYILANNKWNLSLQSHKYIDIP